MTTHRSYGSLDDQPILDGDVGFVGMNLRDQPNQLKSGEITLSKNGRIDGFWQPRKGIELKTGQLSSSSLPLKVNFIVLNSSIVISSASRTSNVVTLTLATPHGIAAGVAGYLTIGDVEVSTNPLTGISAGAYYVTRTGASTLTFANTGANGAVAVHGTYGYVITTINDSAVSGIYGSCLFSDPSSSLDESIILATPNDAKKVSLSNYAITSLTYPAGVSVTAECNMIQAFDRIYLFRDGQRTLEYIPKGRNITASSYVSATGVVTVTLPNHGFTAGDVLTIASVGFVTTTPNGASKTVVTVLDEDRFTYVIATGGGNETYTANTGTAVSGGFSKVTGGVYAQPQMFTINGNVYGVTSGSLRLTVAGNTTISVGDTISINDTTVPELLPIVGKDLNVTSASATEIYVTAPIGDVTYGTGSATKYIRFGGRFSVGGGFIRMPAPAWGVYFQRRLWTPYSYSPTGTEAAPTYTARNVRDEIVASDILDSNTFDSIDSQFRITGGIADYIVGLHPFYDDAMLVLNRNSLHLINGTQGSLADTVVKELTREVGCVARKSIVSQGNSVFFLGDNGVYGLSFIDQYNLRGIEKPLSVKIQPYIDRINRSLASNAVGIYFNNRYYLAVPLDSSLGANDALGNNTVLIYNMLNNGWESIDTYGDGSFLVANFHIGQAEERNDLYLINTVGGLHLADSLNSAADTYSLNYTGSSTTSAIDYQLSSRGYGVDNELLSKGFFFNSFDRKKFKSAQVQMKSSENDASDVDFWFTSEDPDTVDYKVTDIEALLDTAIGLPGQLEADETGNFRFRLGNPRGIYGILTIKRKIVGSASLGRPKVTSMSVEASITNRSTLTQY